MNTENVAVEVTGELTNLNELTLGTGEIDRRSRASKTYSYPGGQALRGAFGYIFLSGGFSIAQTYAINAHPVLYFKDAFPYHYKDGGIFYPVITPEKYVNYQCQKCKEIVRYPTFTSVITRTRIDRTKGAVSMMWRQEGITKKAAFRFKVIVKLKDSAEEYLSDFIAALRFVQENGIALGRRSAKGNGKILLENLQYKLLSAEDLRSRAEQLKVKDIIKIRLLSDAIIKENGTYLTTIPEKALLRSVKNAAKFFGINYKDISAKLKLANYVTARPVRLTFLDAVGRPETAVPKGSVLTYNVEEATDDFYTALALLEMCSGLGSRSSAGKGEIVVE